MQIEQRGAMPAGGRRSAWRAWIIATRPHTLTISINPVLVGCALVWAETGRINLPVMLACMLGALLLQLGANLDNDVSDFERGTDRAGRLGLPRATQLGLLSTTQVRAASRGCFLVATALGLALAWRGGWPILLAGVLAAAAAMAYSGGPRPISYTPYGDLVVLIFFGFVAVCGTYYLQTLSVSPGALAAAAMVGLPASAVLVVNNYRDLEPDRHVGKMTLAVRAGRAFTRWEYAALLLLPFGLLAVLAQTTQLRGSLLAPLLTLPLALGLVRQFWTATPGPAFNPLLARTAKFQVFFSLALCVAIVLR